MTFYREVIVGQIQDDSNYSGDHPVAGGFGPQHDPAGRSRYGHIVAQILPQRGS